MITANTKARQTARELKEERLKAISAKMSAIGGELASWRFGHPNGKQLVAELEALREEYRRVDAEP